MTLEQALNVLGLTQTDLSDMKTVQRKYRVLAKTNHPDIGGDPKVMASINEAYEIITTGKPTTEGSVNTVQDIRVTHEDLFKVVECV